jgi:hypothetical protein
MFEGLRVCDIILLLLNPIELIEFWSLCGGIGPYWLTLSLFILRDRFFSCIVFIFLILILLYVTFPYCRFCITEGCADFRYDLYYALLILGDKLRGIVRSGENELKWIYGLKEPHLKGTTGGWGSTLFLSGDFIFVRLRLFFSIWLLFSLILCLFIFLIRIFLLNFGDLLLFCTWMLIIFSWLSPGLWFEDCWVVFRV